MPVLIQCYLIIVNKVISAPGHGKEVVNGINDTDKRYIYQLMTNVQLPGSKTFDPHILMHSCTQKNDASLAKQLQKYLSKEHHKNVFIDQGKYSKIASKRKWTNREYHVQDNAHVAHKYFKFFCDTNQSPKLPFGGPHQNPHGARGLSKHDHLSFDPKLGHGICAIHRITYACVGYTSMLDQPWISMIH